MKIFNENSIQQWLMCFSTGFYILFMFIIVMMPNTLSPYMIKNFHFTESKIDQLSALFFWSNLVALIPAGIISDHFQSKQVILVGLGLMLIGTALFSFIKFIFYARILSGVGGAFSFVSCLKFCSQWLSLKWVGVITGILTSFGFIGGAVAQWPLEKVMAYFGFSETILILSCSGLLIWLLLILVLRNPQENNLSHKFSKKPFSIDSLTNPFNYITALYSAFLSQPIYLLGGLVGISILTMDKQLSMLSASVTTSFIFIGGILGTPLTGWISDQYKKPPTIMLIGAIMTLFALIAVKIAYNPAILSILFFLIGFFSSTQALGYSVVYKINFTHNQASASSIISLTTMGAAALMELFANVKFEMIILICCLCVAILISSLLTMLWHKVRTYHDT